MAKAWQGKAQQCKGFALFRNDTKRHGNDMLATEELGHARRAMRGNGTAMKGKDKLRKGKGWAMLAMERQSKDRFATAATEKLSTKLISNGNALTS